MTPIDWITLSNLAVLVLQLALLAFQAWFLYGTLNATKLAAEAAKKSADVAEKSVDNIERAFVLVDRLEFNSNRFHYGPPLGHQSPSTPPSVDISLKNHGRSPALLTELRASIEMLQNNSIPFIRSVPLENAIVIGTHDSWKCTLQYMNSVSEGEWSQIKNEAFHFWVFVSVRYQDMLGKEHQTQMRFIYSEKESKFAIMQGDDYTIRT
jgi:hypothetical protein